MENLKLEREKFYKILEGILLLQDCNEFELINLGYTDEEIEICNKIFKEITTIKLK